MGIEEGGMDVVRIIPPTPLFPPKKRDKCPGPLGKTKVFIEHYSKGNVQTNLESHSQITSDVLITIRRTGPKKKNGILFSRCEIE